MHHSSKKRIYSVFFVDEGGGVSKCCTGNGASFELNQILR